MSSHKTVGVPAAAVVVPRYATIPRWEEVSGVKRTRTFELIRDKKLRAIKVGSRTLIDVQAGLAWLDSLPTVNGPEQKAPA